MTTLLSHLLGFTALVLIGHGYAGFMNWVYS